jgi:hypothetical protein
MNTRTPPSFPNRKISETLIDFAAPIVAMLDEHTREDQIRSGFIIAVTVWNALVFDAVRGDEKYLSMLRRSLGERLDSDPMVQTLIRRKRERFGDDMRAIGDHTVTYQGGDLRVWAEARDPYTCLND